jgi:hypothetical protein
MMFAAKEQFTVWQYDLRIDWVVTGALHWKQLPLKLYAWRIWTSLVEDF